MQRYHTFSFQKTGMSPWRLHHPPSLLISPRSRLTAFPPAVSGKSISEQYFFVNTPIIDSFWPDGPYLLLLILFDFLTLFPPKSVPPPLSKFSSELDARSFFNYCLLWVTFEFFFYGQKAKSFPFSPSGVSCFLA